MIVCDDKQEAATGYGQPKKMGPPSCLLPSGSYDTVCHMGKTGDPTSFKLGRRGD